MENVKIHYQHQIWQIVCCEIARESMLKALIMLTTGGKMVKLSLISLS